MKTIMFKMALIIAVSSLSVAYSAGTHTMPRATEVKATSSFSSSHTFQNELLVNMSGGELLIEKYCNGCSSETVINAQVSYLRYLQDKVQVGGEVGASSSSGDTSFNIVAVGAYNIDADLKNSYYAKFGMGLFSVQGALGGSDTKFGFFAGAGKRFSWLSNITYSPEVRLLKKGDLGVSFQATFLNFSVYWN